jgi:hypothetical protein
MKKIKIMLLSFALLAVVGGALAFKAKFTEPLCYRTTVNPGSNPLCSVSSLIKTTDDIFPNFGSYFTTTPQDLSPTYVGLTCYTWVNPAIPSTTTTVPCTDPDFITID